MSDLPGNLSLITGFISPIFHDELRGLNGLSQADFDKCAQGYACPKCLASFSTYLPACPIPGCGWERDIAADLQENLRPDWQQHIDNRSDPTVGIGQIATPEDALRHLSDPQNAEQVPLSKLRKVRRG